jgi:hypothetical protein
VKLISSARISGIGKGGSLCSGYSSSQHVKIDVSGLPTKYQSSFKFLSSVADTLPPSAISADGSLTARLYVGI